MRILVDLTSHLLAPSAPEIVQVQRVPEEGGTEVINGKYAIPMPMGLDFPIDSTSHILNGAGQIDGTGVVSESYAHLLALYPMFSNIYFNPLLTSDHVAELVLDQSYYFTDRTLSPPSEFYPRFQTGRETGVADPGQMPTHTALMAANGGTTISRPGFIITDEIDISSYTLDCDGNPVGADEFMVYWKLYSFTVSHDIAADAGGLAGTNTPAYRRLVEVDQEPTGFTAYITTDDGANWCAVDRMAPVAYCDKSTAIRLAFRNDSSSKVYIASYALLF